MIVEKIEHNGCTSYIDDSAYAGKTEEEVKRIIQNFSNLIVRCMKENMEKAS